MRNTKAVYFVRQESSHKGPLPEIWRAVRNLASEGVRSGILFYDHEKGFLKKQLSKEKLPEAAIRREADLMQEASLKREADLMRNMVSEVSEDTVPQAGPEEALLLCDEGALLRELRGKGFYTAGYSHAFNKAESFGGASFVVQEPDLVDPDSYEKMYQRQAGLPWTILRTPRCVVREFAVDDLEQIYRLYDAQARRFITPPSEDRERERDILRAYIERIYPFYGFGYWAVTAGDGDLIGRVGFAPLTSRQEKEAVELGMLGDDGRYSCFDADFGFLIRPDCRGLGIASEVSRALLEYGFSQLGFTCVRADARLENEASLRLLRSLGFSCIGTREGRQIFRLTQKALSP